MGDYEVATFDCYGTLIDWEGGAAQFLYQHALRHDRADLVPGRELRDEWERLQFALLQQTYRPYKQVLAESLQQSCGQHAWPYDQRVAEDFVESMRSWQPFPDTGPALTRARAAGLRLVIMSNTDNDIVEHSLRHMQVPFDDVITAEDCGTYKPDPTFFHQAVRRIGVPSDRILHVAFGFKYDHAAASAAGMPIAWVNRHAEPRPEGPAPDHEWRDLWGLAALADGRPVLS
jgi:2-haloacid dehalogenase